MERKIKQDDVIILPITDYGMDGEGIGKVDGYTVFVPFTAVGETVKVKVTYVKRNLVFANLLEVIVASENRVNYQCNRFMRCGGCNILHLRYGEQLKIKRQNLINLLRKNTNIAIDVDATVPSPKPLAYRNKIQLPFGTVNGKVAVGFYRRNSHKIVSITKCFLHGDWVERVIGIFLAFANEHNLTAFDDDTKQGLLRHLVVRNLDDKLSMVLVINGQELPHKERLIAVLEREFSTSYSLYISPKLEHNNVVMGKSVYPLVDRPLKVNILGIDLTVNPYSFMQLNDKVRDAIYTRVINEIGSGDNLEHSIVIDAYAGVGLLGAILAKRGACVYNIEIVPEAIADANILAQQNGIKDKVTNILGDTAIELPKLIKRTLATQSATNSNLNIILDPPRKGCDIKVITALNQIKTPHKLCYISCNPATLTRDLALLNNYTIDSITPYDMFPQTKHLETLVVMSRKADKKRVEEDLK